MRVTLTPKATIAALVAAGLCLGARRLRRPRLARSAAVRQGRRHRQVGRSRRHPARKRCPAQAARDLRSRSAAALSRIWALQSPPCITSITRTACSTPRMSRSRALAAEVGTPFYCYSTATLQRHYRVLTEAFAGQDALICFAVKANSNQAVLRTLAKLGAGMDVVSEGELRRALAAGVPAEQDHLRRRRQDARGDGLRAGAGHPRLQRRERAGAARAERGGRRPRADGAHGAARQPGRRRQDARQDLHRQGGEQVRHSLRPGARSFTPRPASCRASPSPASTCTSAARSPIWSRSATLSG